MKKGIQENNLWSLAGQVSSIRCALSRTHSGRPEVETIWNEEENNCSLTKIGKHGPWNVWVKTDLPAG